MRKQKPSKSDLKNADIAKRKGVKIRKPKAHQIEKEWQRMFIG